MNLIEENLVLSLVRIIIDFDVESRALSIRNANASMATKIAWPFESKDAADRTFFEGRLALSPVGIIVGMRSGLPKYIPINLKDVETAGFEDGDEVSLETLKSKGLINPSGRERRLPLKILGTGELSMKLTFKARAFSIGAKEKLEASGCTLKVLPGRKKWVKPSVAKNLARADEYFAKKRAAAAAEAASASEPAASA
ncbi:hypothetical protein AALP_AA5G026400 [Arabis alpina]|uniref:Large ribosomal subunit protein uL15/eL18 domain-containing protein n=1 Tax=Arabis alpina TaxID=50452 RepID=A0A087GUI5_ARAAL|nr:hypothetical protein AALP_AA5G026400 [Arabis alpina]